MTVRLDPVVLARIPALTAPLGDVVAPLRRIAEGQLLQGRVLAAQDGRILIALLGKQIAVDSRLPLQVGQVLNLAVREIRTDRITLQIVRETEGQAPVLEPLTDQDLGELLLEQHLPADPANAQIARALIRQALPVTDAIVSAARRALSFIDAPTATDVDAAIFLMARQLPVTPQSLELAKGALLQSNNLGAGVQSLATQLVELLSHAAQADGVSDLPPDLVAAAQQTLQDLPLLLPDQAQGQTLAALTRQALDRIGTPMEARLARLLDESDAVPPGTGPPQDRIEIGSPVIEAAEAAMPRSPASASERHADVAQADGRATLQATPHRELHEIAHDFRRQLASLRDTIETAAAELPRRHPAAALLRSLEATIREITSLVEREQLVNAGMPPPTQAQGYFQFHLPIAVAGQQTPDTAEVRLYYRRRDRDKRVHPDDAHLAFLLQMSRLGPVDVHVDVYHNHLRCRIECSRQDAADRFQESSHELEERLQGIGWIVDSIRTVTVAEPDAPTDRASQSPLVGIDIRA